MSRVKNRHNRIIPIVLLAIGSLSGVKGSSFSFSLSPATTVSASSVTAPTVAAPSVFSFSSSVASSSSSSTGSTATVASATATYLQGINTLQSQLYWLSLAVDAAIKAYQGSSAVASTPTSFSFTTQATPITLSSSSSSQAPAGVIGVNQSDAAQFSAFFNLLSSSSNSPYNLTISGAPASGPSYWMLLQDAWQLYATYAGQLSADQAASAAQGAFGKTSLPIQIYSQIATQLISFITMRLAQFQGANYGASGVSTFIATELPQLDALMGVTTQSSVIPNVTKSFADHINGSASDGFPNISQTAGTALQQLTANYLAISSLYQSQKGIAIFNYFLTLLKTLTVQYPTAAALSGQTTTLLGYDPSDPALATVFSILDGFYKQAQQSLSFFNKQSPVPSVGSYASPTAALQDLASNSSQLYLSLGLSVKNVINQLCQSSYATVYQNIVMAGGQVSTQNLSRQTLENLSSPEWYATAYQNLLATGSQSAFPQNMQILQNIFQQTLQGFVTQMQTLYTHAASDYALALDAANSSLYAQVSSLLSSGLSNWQKADASVRSTAFTDAFNAYQTAAQMFQQAGLVGLAIILNHKANGALLGMYQLMLQSYTNYYNTQLSSLYTQMITPPSSAVTFNQAASWHTGYPSGLVQLFYYDPGTPAPATPPAFQGIAWLAGNAVTAFSAMLNMYQTDTSSTGLMLKAYFAQSVTLLQTLADASQGLFYNNPLASSMSIAAGGSQQLGNAANANIGALTVEGAVEGRLQSIQIRQQFGVVDTNMLNNPTQGAIPLPFEGLFGGVGVQNFADLSKLMQLYWSLMNVDPALADVTQYSSYAQELVSAAVLLLSDVKALSSDASLAPLVKDLATWAQQKQQAITGQSYGGKTAAQLIEAKGDALAASAQTVLDFESVVACYQVAVQLGSSTAASKYGTALQSLAGWYVKSSIPYASLYAAFTHYRGILAVIAGWQIGYAPAAVCQQQLTSFIQALTTALSSLQSAVQSTNYTQALSLLQDLVSLDAEVEFLAVRQTHEQLLLGLQGKNFITRTQQTTDATGVAAQVPPAFQSTQQPVVSYQIVPFKSLSIPVFVEPNLNSAQISYAQAQALLANFKLQFQKGQYSNSTQTTFAQINQNYLTAAQSFSQAGRQDLVLMAQQALTEATAFSYYSAVIPSKATQALLSANLASQPVLASQFLSSSQQTSSGAGSTSGGQGSSSASGAQSFTFSSQPASPTTQQSSSQVASSVSFSFASAPSQGSITTTSSQPQTPKATTGSLVSNAQPAFLLSYFEDDLTQYAQTEAQFSGAQQAANQTQQQGVASAQSAGATVTTQNQASTYASILAAATAALGTASSVQTSPSNLALVNTVVTPLYGKKIADGGFSDDFVTFSQELTRYQTQVSALVTGGMDVGAAAPLFAQYSLVSRTMADGENHIILCSQNSPLQAIPRFANEAITAIYYYTQYARFYSSNPSTVQIGGATYYQLADADGSKRASATKNSIGAYLAKLTDYQNLVTQIMQSAPSATSLQAVLGSSFSSYTTTYSQLASAYSWIYSVLGSIVDVQTAMGVSWISNQSLNNLYFQSYLNQIQATQKFLLGSPQSTAFSSVMNDISGLVNMATAITQTPSQQAQLISYSGDAFMQAGRLMYLTQPTMPSAGIITDSTGKKVSYPNPAANSIPVNQPNLTQAISYQGSSGSVSPCMMPINDGVEGSSSFTISWKPYYSAAQYFMQAVAKYGNAYAAANNGATNALLNDAKTQNAWGITMLLVMQEVAQQMSLFGRNAFAATTTTTSSGAFQTTMSLSPQFTQIVNQGQTGGGAAAAQGFSALQGGAMTATNASLIQNQYTIMNKLLLDALIYCSYALNQTNNLLTMIGGTAQLVTTSSSGTTTVATDPIGSLALLCGLNYYLPGLQMLAAHALTVQTTKGGATQQQNTSMATNLADYWAAYKDISISQLGTPDMQQIMCASTLPALINYLMRSIFLSSSSATFDALVLGTSQASFGAAITDKPHAFAMNNVIGQLYNLLQTVYTWAFLPPAPTAQQQQQDSKAYANYLQQNFQSIAAAMKAEQQSMAVNAQGYVGG